MNASRHPEHDDFVQALLHYVSAALRSKTIVKKPCVWWMRAITCLPRPVCMPPMRNVAFMPCAISVPSTMRPWNGAPMLRAVLPWRGTLDYKTNETSYFFIYFFPS